MDRGIEKFKIEKVNGGKIKKTAFNMDEGNGQNGRI